MIKSKYLYLTNGTMAVRIDTETNQFSVIDIVHGRSINPSDQFVSEAKLEIKLLDYATVEDVQRIASKIHGFFKFKGTCASLEELQTKEQVEGHCWQIGTRQWVWNGSAWVELGIDVDIDSYVAKSEMNSYLSGKADLRNPEFINSIKVIGDGNILAGGTVSGAAFFDTTRNQFISGGPAGGYLASINPTGTGEFKMNGKKIVDSSGNVYSINGETLDSKILSVAGNLNTHVTNADIHVTAQDKLIWNAKQNEINNSNKLAYSLLSGTPNIPSKVSQLENDSHYLTKSCSQFPAGTITENVKTLAFCQSLISKLDSSGADVGMIYMGTTRLLDVPLDDPSSSSWETTPKQAELLVKVTGYNYNSYILQLQLSSTGSNQRLWISMYFQGNMKYGDSKCPWFAKLLTPIKEYDASKKCGDEFKKQYMGATVKYVDDQISGKVTFKLVDAVPEDFDPNTLYGIPED